MLTNALQYFLKNPMAFILLVSVIFGVGVLWFIQSRKDSYDLRYLITDDKTKQPSIHKMGELIALFVSTWMVVYLTIQGRINENYFSMYMGIWAASQVANKWVSNRPGGGPDDHHDDRHDDSQQPNP
jgi:hypothetical protein